MNSTFNITIDTETTGLKWYKDKIFFIAIRKNNKESYSINLNIDKNNNLNRLKDDILKADNIIFHNAKFDIHFLKNINIDIPFQKVHDTMLMASLINEHTESFSLDYLSRIYLGKQKHEAKRFMKNLPLFPNNDIDEYAQKDAELTEELFLKFEIEIKNQNLENIYNMERQLIEVLWHMEREGINIDVSKVYKTRQILIQRINTLYKNLINETKTNLNVNSQKQIQNYFKPEWKKGRWHINNIPLNNTEKCSFDNINLQKLSINNPVADLILKIRHLQKLVNTFLDGHLISNHHNGKIFTNFHQLKGEEFGTITGRISCSQPNLQQICKRDIESAEILRTVFLPDNNQKWFCADWQQMEFRVFAHYINNKKINEKYNQNPCFDFHQLVAELTGLPRTYTKGIKGNAKQINLGLVFGMGEGALAKEMNLPYEDEGGRFIAGEEAKEIFNLYHSRIQGVRAFLNRASSIAKTRGYIKTLLGRKIRFPNKEYVYKAGGLLFQGTSADCMKQKLINIFKLLNKQTEGRLMLTIHDEFNLSIINEEKLKLKLKHELENFSSQPLQLKIPIKIKYNVGDNWYQASCLKEENKNENLYDN